MPPHLIGVCLLSILLSACGSSSVEPAATGASSPINKVVALLTQMKAQTEAEVKEDMEAYDKYKCWCITTEQEKKDAIETAKKQLDALNGFVQESAGKEGELKTEIAGLEDDIAKDNEALASAKAIRKEENEAFLAEEADLKETLDLLSQAIAVLSKVQLVQKSKGPIAGTRAAAQALVQVRALTRRFKMPAAKFNSVIMKDLFDLLGAFNGAGSQTTRATKAGAFLGQSGRSLPWIKSAEQIGKEANPNDLKGAAAGAKSYNSRSGRILGVLKELGDENAKDLATAQKEELQGEIDFQNLQAAKLAEIAAATEQKNQKEEALADLLFKVARARHDIEQTTKQLDADEKFLLELTKNCKVEDEEYANRVKVRSEEIKALGETMDILTGDEARSLFDKTVSFLQVGVVSRTTSAQHALAREKAASKAMQRIVQVARKYGNWQLASLAVRVKLDAFTKVKEAMDKMLVELKAEQKAEYDKWETCKKEIDETEDKIKEKDQTKEDLDGKHKELTNTLAMLAKQISQLEAEIAEMEVSLKQAGEQRKEQNHLYQTTVADQRATIQILKMASARLEKFYGFAEVSAHAGAAPPPKPKAYKSQANSGGVMQLLKKIVADAESVEIEVNMGEQNAQKEYAAFVSSTTASIEADRQSIEGAKEQTASAESAKSETEESQLANDEALKQLAELLKGTHMDCDFVLKYFEIRQKARAEEMDSIVEAKAILSGADFS